MDGWKRTKVLGCGSRGDARCLLREARHLVASEKGEGKGGEGKVKRGLKRGTSRGGRQRTVEGSVVCVFKSGDLGGGGGWGVGGGGGPGGKAGSKRGLL